MGECGGVFGYLKMECGELGLTSEVSRVMLFVGEDGSGGDFWVLPMV